MIIFAILALAIINFQIIECPSLFPPFANALSRSFYQATYYLLQKPYFLFHIFLFNLNIYQEKVIGLMKSSGLMQLTVQVGTCIIPQLPYLEYSLTVRLTNPLSTDKDITASTTFKPNEGNFVNFATKLFLKIDKGILEQIPSCSVIVTGIDQKSSRCQVGRGEAKTCGEGIQSIRIRARGMEECWLQARLQFCTSIWQVKQTKTNNNRLSNFKSQLSQKQSSSEQKQSHPSKTSTLLTHNEQNQPKSADSHYKTTIVKESKSQKILPQLQNSTATTKESGKNDQQTLNRSQSELLLTMQMKIDSLQEIISTLQEQLRAVSDKMKQAEQLLQDQQDQRVKLQETKEQLSQLLILQEQKNNICLKHIERLNKLIQTISNPQDNSFQLIEEKDEIIMLNQELQKEIINKNITINQMKNQIQQLQNKIISFQSVKLKNLPPQIHQIPKMAISSNKIIGSQKPKIEKRPSERNIAQRRSEELSISNKPKDTKKGKQKQVKQLKNEPLSNNKKPAIPKNPREVKSPMTPKSEASLSIRTPKTKVVKVLKVQQKATMQTQKRSQMEQSLQSFGSINSSDNLMINSRSKEGQFSKLKQF